jgi:hypothetical protein
MQRRHAVPHRLLEPGGLGVAVAVVPLATGAPCQGVTRFSVSPPLLPVTRGDRVGVIAQRREPPIPRAPAARSDAVQASI